MKNMFFDGYFLSYFLGQFLQENKQTRIEMDTWNEAEN